MARSYMSHKSHTSLIIGTVESELVRLPPKITEGAKCLSLSIISASTQAIKRLAFLTGKQSLNFNS